MSANMVEDRLSNLPDEILIKILSNLETYEVVRSGILSTRWKSVWLSIPSLVLSDNDFKLNAEGFNWGHAKARYINFVDKILVDRKFPFLEKISIRSSLIESIIIIRWMRAAFDRNVSELSIDVSTADSEPQCDLTQDLFSNNKLVVLKLGIAKNLRFPTVSFCFQNLKVLELDAVSFIDDDSLPNLLSSCPVLQDLVLIMSVWLGTRTVNIKSRSLKRLKVESVHEDPSVVLKMVIDVPSAEYLDISCSAKYEYTAKDSSSLVEAKVDICRDYFLLDDTINGYLIFWYEFLNGISNAKFITMVYVTMKSLVLACSYKLPIFHYLNRLEILATMEYNYEEINFSEWTFVVELLKNSPVLESLSLRDYYILPEEHGKASDWDVPDCLVSTLKTIEINYDYTSVNPNVDMEKVKYFLINGRVLQKMTLRIRIVRTSTLNCTIKYNKIRVTMQNSQDFRSSSSSNNASASNVGVNGDGEFPVGYRFCPTDSELIVFYLYNKIHNFPLHHDNIHDVKISDYKPDDLAKLYEPKGDKEWYFFTSRDRKYPNGKRPCRSANKGYWKATGKEKNILYDGKIVGAKTSLVYYEGKPRYGTKTNWIMYEYTMSTEIAPHHVRQNSTDMKLDDCVLCSIHYHSKKQEVAEEKEFLDGQEADNNNIGYEIPSNYQDFGNDQHHNQSVNNIDNGSFQDQDYGNDQQHNQSVNNNNELLQDQDHGNDDQHHNQSMNNDIALLQCQDYSYYEYMMQFPQEFKNLGYVMNSNNKKYLDQQNANYQLEKKSRSS